MCKCLSELCRIANVLCPVWGEKRECLTSLKMCERDEIEVYNLPRCYLSCLLNPNFSLLCPKDFGDYQDGYYSVQTTEGEQIAQLIAGYIDIILKKVMASTDMELTLKISW